MLSLLLLLIQIYLQYCYGQQKEQFYILLLILVSLRLVCACLSFLILKQKRMKDYLKQFVLILLTNELFALVIEKCKNDVKKCAKGFIFQQYFYSLPTLFINQGIIAQNLVENNQYIIGFYLVNLVNLLILSFCNLVSIETQTINQTKKFNLSQYLQGVIRPFLFWYLFSQMVYLSFILTIVWVSVQILLGILISSAKSNIEQQGEYFVSFVLQLDFNFIPIQTIFCQKVEKNAQIALKNQFYCQDWSDVFYNLMLQLNLAVFLVFKVLFDFKKTKLECLICILYIFILPNLINSIISIYCQALQIKNYNKIITWPYGNLKLSKTVSYLSKNLINEGKIYINMEEVKIGVNNLVLDQYQNRYFNQRYTKSYQQESMHLLWIMENEFFNDLKEIKSALINSQFGRFKNLLIHFFDQSQNIQVIILVDQNQKQNYKIVFKPGYDRKFAIELMDIIQYILNPGNPITVQAQESDLADLRIKSIRFERDIIIQNIQHKKLIENILSNNFQSLVFYKHIAEYMPINPSLVLYDLIEEGNGQN
ncbi:transmembrane protein, putative (macronuclear) [Tetrahymena thermophila SB210]|uniref:Transmembrane protein, putative n=1 Tax=Tetrahymena thermophila (strain SB210) TaxID=312017 RepID=Q22CX5_TETTS|nr:transmembrane protein, putative [Tetrahymena thermophila SB210]EAR83144.2 transmembrane protein, putative [Tetrahymena thermophila SB210]|eukprot:XP_001030807.2 transmembrane protein, putative [Tetrahymena thermophila SB210]